MLKGRGTPVQLWVWAIGCFVARIAVEPGAELTLGIMAGGKSELPSETQSCGSEKGGRELKAGTSVA